MHQHPVLHLEIQIKHISIQCRFHRNLVGVDGKAPRKRLVSKAAHANANHNRHGNRPSHSAVKLPKRVDFSFFLRCLLLHLLLHLLQNFLAGRTFRNVFRNLPIAFLARQAVHIARQ